jgi:hypothetical protein
MNRIPLPALIIVTMTAALLAVMVWTLTAAPDTSPPELPTATAPSPYPGPVDPYPAPPTVAPYPAPYPAPVYLPFQAAIGEAYP